MTAFFQHIYGGIFVCLFETALRSYVMQARGYTAPPLNSPTETIPRLLCRLSFLREMQTSIHTW